MGKTKIVKMRNKEKEPGLWNLVHACMYVSENGIQKYSFNFKKKRYIIYQKGNIMNYWS